MQVTSKLQVKKKASKEKGLGHSGLVQPPTVFNLLPAVVDCTRISFNLWSPGRIVY